mmetsp:Transcript_56390/g.138422  ORF Transcript_56390/g.138422 Transcript_56390/m.138422 type:complete len:164 (+) Transcript_56390:16-507(+)
MSVRLLAAFSAAAGAAMLAAYAGRRVTQSTDVDTGEQREEKREGRIKAWLCSRGVTPSNMTRALIVHESLGVALLFGSWGACYVLKPSVRLDALLEHFGVKGATSKALSELAEAAECKVKRLFGTGEDFAGLAKALAESMLIRSVAAPVTVPLKLWATYAILS